MKKKPAKNQMPLFEAGTLWEVRKNATQRKAPKLPVLKSMMEKPVSTIDLATLALLMYQSHNRFVRIIWCSNQNDRIYKEAN